MNVARGSMQPTKPKEFVHHHCLPSFIPTHITCPSDDGKGERRHARRTVLRCSAQPCPERKSSVDKDNNTCIYQRVSIYMCLRSVNGPKNENGQTSHRQQRHLSTAVPEKRRVLCNSPFESVFFFFKHSLSCIRTLIEWHCCGSLAV